MFRTIFFISSSANKKFETLSQKIILFHKKCWGSNKYCGIYKLQCCYDGQFFKTFQTFTIFHLLQNSYFPDTRCHWFIELCWILEVCEGKQCKLCESGSLCQHNNNEQQDMLASGDLKENGSKSKKAKQRQVFMKASFSGGSRKCFLSFFPTLRTDQVNELCRSWLWDLTLQMSN